MQDGSPPNIFNLVHQITRQKFGGYHNVSVDGANQDLEIGVVASLFNADIVKGLLEGADQVFEQFKIPRDRIKLLFVPGAFELALGALYLIENYTIDAVITLGAVIKGETDHYEYVAKEASSAIKQVGMRYKTPVIFGLLTCTDFDQAKKRSGNDQLNKGVEAAISAIYMAKLKKKFSKS